MSIRKQSESIPKREGTSFLEYLDRKVEETRLSFVGTNFGSTRRDSSFIEIGAQKTESSLLVTPSGDTIKQDNERKRQSFFEETEQSDIEKDEDGSSSYSYEDSNQEEAEVETQTKGKSQVKNQDKKDVAVKDGETKKDEDNKEEDVKQESGEGVEEDAEPEGKEGAEDDHKETIPGEEAKNNDIEAEKEEGSEAKRKEGESAEGDKEEGEGKEEEKGEGEEREGGKEEEKEIEKGERARSEEERVGSEEERAGGGREEVNLVEEEKGSNEVENEEESETKQSDEEIQHIERVGDKEEEKEKVEDGKEDEEEKENKDKQEILNIEDDEQTEEEKSKDQVKEDQINEYEEEASDGTKHSTRDDVVSIGLSSETEIKVESVTSSLEHDRLTERLKTINLELSYVNRKHRFLTKEVVDIRGKKVDIDSGESKLTQGYLKKLVNFEKIKFSIQNEMKKINDQVDASKERLRSSVEIYEAAQNEFLQKVSEACKKLDQNSGIIDPEKLIVPPTHRIQTTLANVGKMRLRMVKLQNHLAEKEAELKSLDDRGGGLHLIDYEKLKMHNQHLVETIAERDLELLRLRKKIETDTQKLAHVRERADFVGEENRNYNATLQDLDTRIKFVREDVSKMKHKRQRISVVTRKMRQDAGLLTKPKLVTSYAQTEFSLETAKNQLNDIMQLYQQQKKKIDDLKERVHSSSTD